MPASLKTTGRTLLDSRGRPLRLAAEIGRGGQGSVWEVAGQPDLRPDLPPNLVAKLYHAPTAEKGAKLGVMLGLASERLLKIAAWPVETLHGPNGRCEGFLMPRAAGRPIHVLYGPKSRLAQFPQASWPFLLQSAANLARAFAVVHEHGLVVGDVNHGNSLVSEQATVALIDCDSFQVPQAPRDASRLFYCGVGVETHIPPELQGRDLSRLPRTPNHDAFGLAVLLYQILFMGRHPFSGRFLGAGDMPIPRAIGELRFAYGPGAAGRQMQPPPNTLPLSALTEEAAGLFERAFSTRGRGEEGRPKPREWVAALEALGRDLQVCNRSPAHHFRRGLAACPWCEIESRSAVLLFWLGAPVPGAAGGTFQLALIWARIAAVPHPGKAPSLPDLQSLRPPPSPAAEREGRVRRWRFLCGMFVGLAGPLLSLTLGSLAWLLAPVFLVIAWRIARGGSRPVHDQARLELRVAQAELARLSQAWKTEAGPSAFEAQSQELEKRRAAYLDLPAARQRRLDYLRVNLRQKQLDRYLDSHRLERARIKGIGPARKATLQSFGIETAADVDPFAIPRIPGFGPVMTESLVLWRQELERSFVYDPHRGIDPADLRALETSLATEKAQLERDLAAGAAKLDQLRQRTLRRREELLPLLNAALGKVAQVQADLAVL